jgi:hypothetical protein
MNGKWLMKIKFIILVVLTFLIMGCSHSHRIYKSAYDLNRVNQKLTDNKARIYLMDKSEKISAQNVKISSDSISYFDSDSGTKMRIAASKVNKILINDHGKGFAEGLLVGLSTSGVIFLLLKANSNQSVPNDAYLALGGIGVLILGPIIGGMSGSQDIYIINEIKEENWWRRNN